MGKRFTEYSQFDLSQVNKDVLKKWEADTGREHALSEG